MGFHSGGQPLQGVMELPSAGHSYFHLAPTEPAQGMARPHSHGGGAVKALMTSFI